MEQLDMTSLAIALVRTSLGVLFFFQAYDKIFNVGFKQFLATVTDGEVSKRLPRAFLGFSIRVSSYIELVTGLFLICGMFLPLSYLLLSINLVMVILSFSYFKAMWDMRHVFPRLAMLAFLMVMPIAQDIYHLAELLDVNRYLP